MHSFRKQLLKIQHRVYKQSLQRINNSFASDSSLKIYSREYHKYLRNYSNISSKAELIRHILSSNIVFHGDYHTLHQSQQSIVKILQSIINKRTILLCLEMFYGEDQRLLEQFMSNELSEKEFLKKIDYKKKWGYKWEQWKPVIDICKKNGISISGINSSPKNEKESLRLRDTYAAKIIACNIIRYPDVLIYVVDGDYHVSPNHLPFMVQKLLKTFDIEMKRTIIYQNPSSLYWQLADENKEDANVLQIDSESFCIMNTTPANKLQSYLNWLEYSEDAYYPVQTEWRKEEVEGFENISGTTIPSLVKTICNILELQYPAEAIEHLEVYYGTDLDFMSLICGNPAMHSIISPVKKKIENNEGFLVDYINDNVNFYIIYLPNSSLTMAAEEATHFLNSVLRGKQADNLNRFDLFYYTVMTEVIGFFGSKLINEKRKAQTRNSLRRYIGSFKLKTPSKEEKKKIQLCHLILQHRYIEGLTSDPQIFYNKFNDIYKKSSDSIFKNMATQLGYMLGEKLFYAVKKRRFPVSEVINLFYEPFIEPLKAFTTYLEVSGKITRNIK